MDRGQQFPIRTAMSANEIMASWNPALEDFEYTTNEYKNGEWAGATRETTDEFWARKLREAKTPTEGNKYFPAKPALYDILKEQGVRNWIDLEHPEHALRKDRPIILGGHHRLAAMMEIDPEAKLPVMLHEKRNDAVNRMGY